MRKGALYCGRCITEAPRPDPNEVPVLTETSRGDRPRLTSEAVRG